MKIAITSDLHGRLPEVTPCDLLIVAGDWSHPMFEENHWHSKAYLENDLANWLGSAPARNIVGVAGNHDFIAATGLDAVRALPWTFLHDETVEIDGLKIHGSPWTVPFGGWCFERPEAGIGSLDEAWSKIPHDVDILVTHSPPAGILDVAWGNHSTGSNTLRWHLERLNALKLHAFGHIHESFGTVIRNGTHFVNASHTDLSFRPQTPPFTIDLATEGNHGRIFHSELTL